MHTTSFLITFQRCYRMCKKVLFFIAGGCKHRAKYVFLRVSFLQIADEVRLWTAVE